MKLIQQINLANGLVLSIYDLSRQIAADTSRVEILAKTEISLERSYFENEDDYTQVKIIFGDKISFEYRKERSFIPVERQNEVRDELIDTFRGNSLNYISSPNFPKHLALSKLRDIKSNPYKYRKIPEQEI
ncbi:MAG TPA: hypothetical protein P5294_09155 [Smithellaceae bacterium]|nr:hypothetical protein [Smithellaceae bacterium]HRS89905.1 hypothetical protein [Smithellaceae bacterium]HRV26696.1 hypothetical protein [Smithellaceae bacterium]